MSSGALKKETEARQKHRILVVLSSREAREALGFFKKEFEVDGNNLTVEDALKDMKAVGGESLSDSLVENGELKPTFGMFVGGVNIECSDGLKTRIADQTNIVVIELMSRIAGG
jgi:molybdopterin converting factor small subunit